jgi:tetratricopeptide (TPR) repeat protein
MQLRISITCLLFAIAITLNSSPGLAEAESSNELTDLETSATYSGSQNDAWKAAVRAGREAEKKRNFSDAEKNYKIALKAAEKFGSDDVRVLYCLILLMSVYEHNEKNLPQLEETIGRCIKAMRKLYGKDDPRISRLQFMLAAVKSQLGKPIEDVGNAAPMLREMFGILGIGIPLNDKTLNEFFKELLNLKAKNSTASGERRLESELRSKCDDRQWQQQMQTGNKYLIERNFEEAEKSFTAARKTAELQCVTEPSVLCRIRFRYHGAESLQAIGNVYMAQKRYKEAQQILQQALEKFDQICVPGAEQSLLCCESLGQAEWRLGKIKEATAMYERVVAHTSPFLIAKQTLNHGYLSLLKGNYDHAEKSFIVALNYQHKNPKGDSQTTLKCLDGLAVVYLKQEKYKEAEPLLKEGLEIRKKISVLDSDPDLKQCIRQYATVLRNTGRAADAKSLEQQGCLNP